MKITDIQIRKVEKENSKLVGVATIVLNESIAIHDIKIIIGEKGLFIAMPNRKSADGKYRDVVHPINQETRTMFEEAIIEEYNKSE